MSRKLLPGETLWRTWAEVQADAVRFFSLSARGREDIAALLASADRHPALPCRFAEFVALLEAGAVPPAEEPDASFLIAGLSRRDLLEVLPRLGGGLALEGVELLIRRAVRGHRGLEFADGRPVPFGTSEGGVMDVETFGVYAEAGFIWALACSLLLHAATGGYRG